MSYFARLVQQSELTVGDGVSTRPEQAEPAEPFERDEVIETIARPAPEPGSFVARGIVDKPVQPAARAAAPMSNLEIQDLAEPRAAHVRRPATPAVPLQHSSESIEIAAATPAPAVADTPGAEYVLQRVLEWIAVGSPESAASTADVSERRPTLTGDAPGAIRHTSLPAPEVIDSLQIDEVVTERVGETERVQAVPVRRIGATDRRATAERMPAGANGARGRDSVADEVSVSIGAINVTIETPPPAVAPPPRAEPPRGVRESRPAARLARHYLRP